jgi:hypothetical protein
MPFAVDRDSKNVVILGDFSSTLPHSRRLRSNVIVGLFLLTSRSMMAADFGTPQSRSAMAPSAAHGCLPRERAPSLRRTTLP